MNYNIVLIGSGNVATQLGIQFQKVGHRILQVFSKTNENAEDLASRLNAKYTK